MTRNEWCDRCQQEVTWKAVRISNTDQLMWKHGQCGNAIISVVLPCMTGCDIETVEIANASC